MQETRQYILEILKHRQEATVGDIVQDLCRLRQEKITAVTVRHHLGILQTEGLVKIPETRHRATPGRPQHIYALTDKALSHFPNNYRDLVSGLLSNMRTHLSDEGINVILEGVATDMAVEAQVPDGPLPERLEAAVAYLNEHGYEARWETVDDGYVLHTSNCPYHHLSRKDDAFCTMDMRLVAKMLGVVPRLVSHIASGDASCAYFVPDQTASH